MNEQEKIKDDSKKAAFAKACIPLEYWPKEVSLNSLIEKEREADKVLSWIESDGLRRVSERGFVLEFVGVRHTVGDLLYLTARAFILRSISTKCVYVTDLMPDNLDDDLREDLEERGALVVDRMGIKGTSPLKKDDSYAIEMFLMRWLRSGKSLLFQSEVPIADNLMFTENFRSFVKNRLKATFTVK